MNKQNIMNRLKGFPLSIEQKQELLNIIEENSGGSGVSIPVIEMIQTNPDNPELITEVGNYLGNVASSSEEFVEIKFYHALDLINYLKNKPNIVLRTNVGGDFYLDLTSTSKGTSTTHIDYYFLLQNKITFRLMFYPQSE